MWKVEGSRADGKEREANEVEDATTPEWRERRRKRRREE